MKAVSFVLNSIFKNIALDRYPFAKDEVGALLYIIYKN